ncbi:uncharacterized protein MYCFIDRAFT_180259 [Pseudocercospora fijiensis CIRAD86]|uniref:Uncharacterized protein n=1 Tax=Pseudocercospora fijiensis (strain CIRAD86) TaxID=383855 RepID=M3AHX4_PSEFD|nr:uncharacterized protein MYCFIDRAFT_180259 [Pseudocercospora fijiensis CIRAD86]EME77112.1 hypothetical protein MYCFIDRAFT_180259 [Pseudocercospora fijiensis CIRAD86]
MSRLSDEAGAKLPKSSQHFAYLALLLSSPLALTLVLWLHELIIHGEIAIFAEFHSVRRASQRQQPEDVDIMSVIHESTSEDDIAIGRRFRAILDEAHDVHASLEKYRRLWQDYCTVEGTDSAIEAHTSHEQVANRIIHNFLHQYAHESLTPKDIRSHVRAIMSEKFEWHEDVEGLRYYAIFGADGVSRRFMVELRALASMRQSPCDEATEGGRGLTFAEGFSMMREAQDQRRGETHHIRGTSLEALWRPSDCVSAIEMARERMKMSKVERPRRRQPKRSTEPCAEEAGEVDAETPGEHGDRQQSSARDGRRDSAISEGGIEHGRRGSASPLLDGLSFLDTAKDIEAEDVEGQRKDKNGTEESDEGQDKNDGVAGEMNDNQDENESVFGEHDDKQDENDSVVGDVGGEDDGREDDGGAREYDGGGHLAFGAEDSSSTAEGLDFADFPLPPAFPPLPAATSQGQRSPARTPSPSPSSTTQTQRTSTHTSTVADTITSTSRDTMRGLKRPATEALSSRAREPRLPGAVSRFKTNHLDPYVHSQSGSQYVQLARQFLSGFVSTSGCTMYDSVTNDVAIATAADGSGSHDETRAAYVTVYDYTAQQAAYVILLPLPADELPADPASRPAQSPAVRWLCAHVHCDESADSVIVHSLPGPYSAATLHARLSAVLSHAVPHDRAARIRSIPPEAYRIDEFPAPSDAGCQDPTDFVKCMATAVCLVTDGEPGRHICVWAWISAMCIVHTQSSRLTEYQSAIELPTLRSTLTENQSHKSDSVLGTAAAALASFRSDINSQRNELRALSQYSEQLELIGRCVTIARDQAPPPDPVVVADCQKKISMYKSNLDSLSPDDEDYDDTQQRYQKYMQRLEDVKRRAETPKSLRDLGLWVDMCVREAQREEKLAEKRYDDMVDQLEQLLQSEIDMGRAEKASRTASEHYLLAIHEQTWKQLLNIVEASGSKTARRFDGLDSLRLGNRRNKFVVELTKLSRATESQQHQGCYDNIKNLGLIDTYKGISKIGIHFALYDSHRHVIISSSKTASLRRGKKGDRLEATSINPRLWASSMKENVQLCVVRLFLGFRFDECLRLSSRTTCLLKYVVLIGCDAAVVVLACLDLDTFLNLARQPPLSTCIETGIHFGGSLCRALSLICPFVQQQLPAVDVKANILGAHATWVAQKPTANAMFDLLMTCMFLLPDVLLLAPRDFQTVDLSPPSARERHWASLCSAPRLGQLNSFTGVDGGVLLVIGGDWNSPGGFIVKKKIIVTGFIPKEVMLKEIIPKEFMLKEIIVPGFIVKGSIVSSVVVKDDNGNGTSMTLGIDTITAGEGEPLRARILDPSDDGLKTKANRVLVVEHVLGTLISARGLAEKNGIMHRKEKGGEIKSMSKKQKQSALGGYVLSDFQTDLASMSGALPGEYVAEKPRGTDVIMTRTWSMEWMAMIMIMILGRMCCKDMRSKKNKKAKVMGASWRDTRAKRSYLVLGKKRKRGESFEGSAAKRKRVEHEGLERASSAEETESTTTEAGIKGGESEGEEETGSDEENLIDLSEASRDVSSMTCRICIDWCRMLLTIVESCEFSARTPHKSQNKSILADMDQDGIELPTRITLEREFRGPLEWRIQVYLRTMVGHRWLLTEPAALGMSSWNFASFVVEISSNALLRLLKLSQDRWPETSYEPEILYQEVPQHAHSLQFQEGRGSSAIRALLDELNDLGLSKWTLLVVADYPVETRGRVISGTIFLLLIVFLCLENSIICMVLPALTTTDLLLIHKRPGRGHFPCPAILTDFPRRREKRLIPLNNISSSSIPPLTTDFTLLSSFISLWKPTARGQIRERPRLNVLDVEATSKTRERILAEEVIADSRLLSAAKKLSSSADNNELLDAGRCRQISSWICRSPHSGGNLINFDKLSSAKLPVLRTLLIKAPHSGIITGSAWAFDRAAALLTGFAWAFDRAAAPSAPPIHCASAVRWWTESVEWCVVNLHEDEGYDDAHPQSAELAIRNFSGVAIHLACMPRGFAQALNQDPGRILINFDQLQHPALDFLVFSMNCSRNYLKK